MIWNPTRFAKKLAIKSTMVVEIPQGAETPQGRRKQFSTMRYA
jgi:hypothetical protein